LARSTASHNTLCLNDQSSSTLIRNARLEQVIGAVPIRHPDIVKCTVHQNEAGITVDATHDGYPARFSLIHTRASCSSTPLGPGWMGLILLSAAKGVLELAWDLPFAIHLHLHPEVEASIGQTPDVAEVALDTGELWRLSVTGAALSIEDSTYFADVAGPAPRSASYCAECAARHRGGLAAGAVSARAACSMPRRATASARKSGRPKSTRSDDTSYFAPAVSRQISVRNGLILSALRW
jgi:uncharacterized heparinase superfamily protein